MIIPFLFRMVGRRSDLHLGRFETRIDCEGKDASKNVFLRYLSPYRLVVTYVGTTIYISPSYIPHLCYKNTKEKNFFFGDGETAGNLFFGHRQVFYI